jgi:hypothetical protein
MPAPVTGVITICGVMGRHLSSFPSMASGAPRRRTVTLGGGGSAAPAEPHCKSKHASIAIAPARIETRSARRIGCRRKQGRQSAG